MSADTMPCGCLGHADYEEMCRYPALQVELAQAREARERAERERNEAKRTVDAAVATIREANDARKEEKAARECAEAERDEAKHISRDMGSIISDTMAALDGDPHDNMIGLARALRGDLKRAEADNAALLQEIQRIAGGDGDGQCWSCGAKTPYPHRPPCALGDVLGATHPGAALLEYVRALEAALRGVVERAHNRDALAQVGEVCIIMGSHRYEWDEGIRDEVRQRGDASAARDVALGVATHVLGSAADALKGKP